MGLLVGTLIALAIVYFLIISPGFRMFAIFVVVALGIYIYSLNESGKKESAKRQQAEAAQEWRVVNSIQSDDLNLANLNLSKDYSGWILKGTITNNSKSDLRSIRFLVTIQDCPPSSVCKIIGQEGVRIAAPGDYGYSSSGGTLVPAGQVRQFNSSAMQFVNMPPSTNMRWEYKITEIRAP
jgi:hypothetical protein